MAHPSNPNPEKCSKFVPPDALKIHSLVLPVFRFLFKKFSKTTIYIEEKANACMIYYIQIFFNCDSLHAGLTSHYKAWS